MSKTTILLLLFLFSTIGILLYIVYAPANTSFISSVSTPIRNIIAPSNTSLSFSTNAQVIKPGQTVTFAVLIHNSSPHPGLVQLEISYDPNELTVDSIMPGSFFTNPTVALQNIDPTTGRISYALRCSDTNGSNTAVDCVNIASTTVAVITFTTNSYAFNRTTTLSFLPKTLVRTNEGRDILRNTIGMDVSIGNALYPISSASAIASPGANIIRVTPTH
jgi:hypothetical protein